MAEMKRAPHKPPMRYYPPGKPPTEIGWYWARFTDAMGGDLEICLLNPDGSFEAVCGIVAPPDAQRISEFWGPIPEPDLGDEG